MERADTAAGNALIYAAIDEAPRASADVCAAILNSAGPFFAFLKRRGFVRTPYSSNAALPLPRVTRGSSTISTCSGKTCWPSESMRKVLLR